MLLSAGIEETIHFNSDGDLVSVVAKILQHDQMLFIGLYNWSSKHIWQFYLSNFSFQRQVLPNSIY